MNLNEFMPKDYNDVQRAKALELTRKWERTGLLDGLKGYNKGNMAQLLENQAKQLVTEANATGTSANSEEWAGIALPLVRRVFTEFSAKEFVSVQPMSLPAGLVFWLDFKYGTGQAGFNTGAGKDSQNDSIYGITNPNLGTDQNKYGWGAPAQGLYGAGRFSYTINDVSSSALTPHASTYNSTQYVSSSTVAAADYNLNSEFSQSLLTGGSTIQKITISTASLATPDLNGVRAFTLSGTGVYDVYNEFTKYSAANGSITFLVSGSGFSNDLKVNYHKQPTSTTRGDFEVGKTQDTPIDIPQLNMSFRSEPIVAKTRKIKAVWTPEFAQDIDAFQNIDAEAEIAGVMSEYMAQEIDFEILDMLIQNAPFSDYWSAKIGYEYNGSGVEKIAENVTAYTQTSWFQTIGTKIQKMSNRIHAATMRGGANFIVCSPMVATILESIPGYSSDTDGDKNKFAMGSQRIGSLNSRFQVYKVPYMQENTMLLGYRGANYLETGAAYCPYIPIIMTQTIPDPNTFEPRKGAMTRYAKVVTRPEFYGKVYVHGLNSL